MSATTEAKSILRREIKAQEGIKLSKRKWKRVQFPSSESLVRRYASQLEQLQANKVREDFNLDFGKGLWKEIEGEWRLLYTNNVASAPTTSISLPPPPFSGIEENIEVFRLDSVVQRITRKTFDAGSDVYVHSEVDHILRFELNLPDVVNRAMSSIRGEVVLEHDVKVVSDCYPAKLAIDLRDIKVLVKDNEGVLTDSESSHNPAAAGLRTLLRTIAGVSSNPSSANSGSSGSGSGSTSSSMYLTMLSLPLSRLLGPSYLRRGFFEVTYVDGDTRISRGPFGELRVFERILQEEENEENEENGKKRGD